ncbi:MAG TPA: hypothetical protein VGM05_25440, partial [Planctomycetaceae bacterium]
MTVISRRLILIGLCVIAGCSGSEPPEDAAESDRMLNVLTTALDAWKEGTAATLAQRDPPIRFADDDLAAGRHLMAYHLEDPEAFALPFESVHVHLTLQTADGQTVERTVGYQISLVPSLAVLRSEP